VAKVRVGLDIGSTAVRAAEVAVSGDQVSVLRAAQVKVAEGTGLFAMSKAAAVKVKVEPAVVDALSGVTTT
jgi:Tfp pilus assembly PilM family ATPase